MTREEAETTCIYWACDEPQQLTSETPYAAIVDYLGRICPTNLPEVVTLMGYVRMAVSYHPIYGPLATILEAIDEEHADPDSDGTKPTDAMRKAEETFIAAVLAEYKNWNCEDVYQEEINVRDWCRVHAPDLLDGMPILLGAMP